jgi:hypothetical protein
MLPDPTQAAVCAADVDAFLAQGDPVLAGQLRLALLALEHLGARPLGLVRFSRLDPALRLEVIEAWRTSSFGTKRQIAAAVRRVVLFTWYERPDAWEAVGFDGPLAPA